jgi:hypothetical protein
MSEEIPRAASPRQLKLFHMENPLTLRFGNDFFRSLPEGPGVYFFHGSDGRLLYIGQSSNLRARLGSYRHVDQSRHPKRTVRLVARVTRIEWKECATADEAVELESTLLLEYRPPFNRAGVWKGEPWWLAVEAEPTSLTLRLLRESYPGSFGPLPPSSRHTLGTIVRALLRTTSPKWTLSEFPRGLISSAFPLVCSLQLPSTSNFVESLKAALAGDLVALLAELEALPPPATITEQTYWQEERERLEKLRANSVPPSGNGSLTEKPTSSITAV